MSSSRRILFAALLLALVAPLVARAAFLSPPTAITAISRPYGTIVVSWEPAVTDGSPLQADVVYEVWRKRLDEGAFYRITDGLKPPVVGGRMTFTDNLDPNDVGTNGGDIRMDGTSPDNINATWGLTYMYRVVARDEASPPGVSTTPEVQFAQTSAAQCDNTPPNLQAKLAGPNHYDKVRPTTHTFRFQIDKVDWTVNDTGSIKLLYRLLPGGPVQNLTTFMTKMGGGFPGATVYEGTINLTGAAHGATYEVWVSGQDNHYNPLTSTLFLYNAYYPDLPPVQMLTNSVMLVEVDSIGPSIVDSLYIDFAADGITSGDQWIIRFNEDILTSSQLNILDFELGPAVGGSFGTGATVFPGPLSNEVTITLGGSPNLKFVGPAANRINRINYKGSPLTTITDLAGNPATAATYTVKARNEAPPNNDDLPNGPRPKITKAEFTDVNDNGNFDNPDTLRLQFDKPIGFFNANPTTAPDYLLPVTADALGAAATQAADPADNKAIVITLPATGAVLRVVGIFNPGTVTPGSSSGIDGATTTSVVDQFGNIIEQRTPDAGYDIVGTGTDGPRLVSAAYTDTLVAEVRDGLSGGDRLVLTFNRPLHNGLSPILTTTFRLPVGMDNLDNPTFTINAANRRELFIDFSTNPNLTVFGTFNALQTAQGSPSGIDVQQGTAADPIVDIYGNRAVYAGEKDISANDADGPRITPATANPNAVIYRDTDGNGPDVGDQIEIEFDEPIVLTSPTAADFQLQNLNLGTNPSFEPKAAGVNNRVILVTLGVNPTVVTVGAGRSQIDVVNNTNRIRNWAGINARSDGFRNVESAAAIGPKITTALYTDNGTDGLNAGDVILLTFDKPILVPNIAAVNAGNFQLPVLNDSLGTGPSFSIAGLPNTQLRITLGTNPKMKVGGVFNSANTADGSPSGIDIVNGGTASITDTSGNNAIPNAPAGIDLTSSDATAPTLVTCTWTDATGDGLSAGDSLLLTFSEPVFVETPPAALALRNLAFDLPVAGDTLGGDPVIVVTPQPAPNQIRIQFITAPSFKVAGAFNGNIAGGSSSGIDIASGMPAGMITDIAGNSARRNTPGVGVNGYIDIGAAEAIPPTVVSAVFTDRNGNGPDAGDLLDVTFSEPVLVNPTGIAPQAADFTLGNGGSLGTNPTFAPFSGATNNTVVRITLGAGCVINFSPPAAATSTIDVTGTIQSITDISGNGATQSTQKTIASASAEPPYIVAAVFSDADGNGLDQGDTIHVSFNKEIFIAGVTAADFQLPATDNGTRVDSFGAGVQFAKVNARTLEITLGVDPILYIPGAYSGVVGKASGIDIAALGANSIRDAMNNAAAARTTGPVDIVSFDTKQPRIVESWWSDENANGAVDQGDTLSVRFDMPVYLATVLPACFNLPVAGDQLNFSGFSLAGTDTIYLTLANPVNFLVRGTYNPATVTPGSPSGISIANPGSFPAGSIISHSGANAGPSTPAVDIFSRDGTGPVLLAAEYEDLNRTTLVDAGDVVELIFSENILINGPVPANFNLVNGSFGANPAFGPGGGPNILKVTLGTGAALTFLGANTSSVDVIGTIQTVTDYSGNGARQSTQKFIVVKGTAVGPKIVRAIWTDVAPPGVGVGDRLHLVFNRDITTNSLAATDFVLPVGQPPAAAPPDSFGVGPVFSQPAARTIEIILGGGATFQPIGLFNPVSVDGGSPSGIDISAAGALSGHIVDMFGYRAEANSPVGIDIESSDNTGPVLLTAVFRDLDLNGVDAGDQILLDFDENIRVQTPLTVASGDFTVTNGNLGTNPSFYYNSTAPTQLVITLGVNPSVTVRGVFPGDPGATGIDIRGIIASITDLSGLGAKSNGGVDIGPFETQGPTVLGARYLDNNASGRVDAGDFVIVVFDEPVLFDGVTFADFLTPVLLDTIGGSPSFAPTTSNREIRITLGSNPVITPTGEFRDGVVAVGSPSGIDVANTTHITDVYGNPARSSVAKDIDDGVGPYIVAATYEDLDFNGVDQGDRLRLRFSEPVILNGPTVLDFQLPVAFDTIGPDPVILAGPDSTEVDIFLGTNAVLTIPEVFSPLRVGQWSPSGINLATTYGAGHITDRSGNDAIRSVTPVDIGGNDNRPPTLQLARWVDNGAPGVSAGDHLILTFDEVVKVNGFLYTNFHLPCAQNALGSPVTIEPSQPGVYTNEITLTLGSGARLTIPGVYVQNAHGVNDPSGIDISPGIIQGHIWDIYGNTAVNSQVRDIAGADGTGPRVIACTFWDTDNNGPDAGDILGVAFDKPVQFRTGQTAQADEFALPVTGNTFGTNPVITQGTTNIDLRITLGEGAFLTIPGVYGPTTNLLDPASPSGIRTTGKPNGAIIDYSGNAPQDMTAADAIDIISASSVGPTLLAATIRDANGNRLLDQGDRMVLTFDRAVTITPAFALTDLTLPIASNTFGVGATFEVNAANRQQLFVGLGAGPFFTVEGIFTTIRTAATDPSGVGLRAGAGTVTDLGGIPAAGGTVLDIADEYNPYVLAATYTDTGDDGLGALDLIDVVFSEAIVSNNIVVTDFALSGPTDTFGTGATFQQVATSTVRITLGTNPTLTVAGVYPAPGASGIDLSVTFNSGHIRDQALNPAVRSQFKDIAPADATAPFVTRAVYGDANGNGLVDSGDTVSVFFSKAVVVSGSLRSDFAVTNGSFGTGGNEAVVKGRATNEVVITLGATPILNVEGIYPTDATASAVDIGPGYVAGRITTVAGANPVASTPKDIEDLLGPVPQSVTYTDTGADGVGQGDLLLVTFNRTIVVPGNVNAGGFFLPVQADSLGASPSFAQATPTQMRITLGTGARLRVSGTFLPGAVTAGSPSGFNISTTGLTGIVDVGGRHARPAPQPLDIRGVDATPPALLSAVFNDRDGNGVTQGDEITLTFDEPVFLDPATGAGDFLVTNGSLGQGPSFRISPANNKAIVITLGVNPALTLFGGGQTAIGRADATYVPGRITDIAGNDWGTGTQVGVVSLATENPRLIKATFTDVDNLGLGPGDRITLRFTIPVVVGGGASVNDFRLPVAGDTFGGNAQVQAGLSNRDVDILLGIGARIKVAGTFSPAALTVGSASGIDIDGSSVNITSLGGRPAQANAVALDIGSDDATPPAFTSATLTGTGGPNLVKAEGDTVTLTATLDDPSLIPADILADFTALGGGSAVAAATYVGGTAQWLAVATGSLRDSVSVSLKATDVAGNVGNYAARANVIQPVAGVLVEVTPNQALRGSGVTQFTVHLKPTIPDYCTGMDEIHIRVPVSGPLDPRYYYSHLDVSAATVRIDGETLRTIGSGEPAPGEARVTADPATGIVSVKLGRFLAAFNVPQQAVRVTFRARVPAFADEPEGKPFHVTVDNSLNRAAVTARPGDADGIPGNGDSNIVQAVGIKIVSIEEKFVISATFWKIVFTVKFNSNMDIENSPQVLFRTVGTLMNEQAVHQLSFVDGTWMGYTIVPFANFGFATEYELFVNRAKDYLGTDVNNLSMRKRFSPKFLIGAHVHAADERTLVIGTRYLRSATDEALVAKPLVTVQQTGTAEATLIDTFETARPDTWLGQYQISRTLGGNAQIEVQGTTGPSGTKIRGTAIAEFSTAYMTANSGGVLLSPDASLSLSFAPGSLPRAAQVTIIPDAAGALAGAVALAPGFPARAPSAEELVPAGAAYDVYPADLSLAAKAGVAFAADPSAAGAGLFVDSGAGWRFVGRLGEDGRTAGEVASLGRFALFRDLRGPQVKPPDETVVHAETLPFAAFDAGSGVDAAATRILVNGQPAAFDYDEAAGILTVKLPERMVQGTHDLSGMVVDRMGNATAIGRAAFQAAGFADLVQVMAYPNPARDFARVRYTLGMAATDLSFRIYDGGGRLVHAERMMPAGNYAAGTHDTPPWMLLNEAFRPVANGTYFYKLTATCANGKRIARTGKIAVLR